MSSSDDMPDKPNSGVSRRSFLKGTGLVISVPLVSPGVRAITVQGAEVKIFGPDKAPISLTINGAPRKVTVEPRTTLLDTLRNELDLTGAKPVCDRATCGACTVIMDGKPIYSCSVLAIDAEGKKITTVEGLGTPNNPNAVQAAFVEHDALMCGFCTPGFVTTISAYLKKNPNPSLDEVREACKGNFCRCGTYPRVFEAALAAAKQA